MTIAAPTPVPDAGRPRAGDGRTPVRILLVDDNAAKRLALRSMLSQLGYPIVEAESGLAALRCLMAEDFAVILLDVRMPVMNGFETAALIRQRARSEMTPIIFITAHAKDDLDSDLYAQGAVDFIFAPVVPHELKAKVSVFANLFARADELAAQAREVQASADQLRLLTEAAPIGIFQTDAEGRYVYTNPRWSEITGVAAPDALGREWDAVVAWEELSEIGLTAIPATAGSREIWRRGRFELTSPDVAARIVLVTSKSTADPDGRVSGWVGTLADITAEAGAEAVLSDARDKATEASQLKSDFLANMSHEIRTPMNGVIGMTDLLLETDLDARQRDYAQTVRNSGHALMTLIDAILDFSKVEAGKLELEEIEFAPRGIVEDVLDLLAGLAQSKRLELMAVVESSVPPRVYGDPGRVRQVLTNLVGNAIKFTQAGEVLVRVSAEECGDGESLVRFDVSDTGDGIPDEKLELIFEPFAQADTSTSRRYGGTGLGLAISSQLTVLMGGSCGLSSRVGEGSSFWFTIRAHSEQRPPAEPSPELAELAGVSALIGVENETLDRVLSYYLRRWGMPVTSAGSAEAALEAIRAQEGAEPFAVVLFDRDSSSTDGSELQSAIAALPSPRPGLVLLTRLDGDVAAKDESAVRASLSKPVHLDALRSAVLIALGLQEAPAAPDALEGPGRDATVEAARGRLLLAEDNLVNQKVAVAMLSGAGYQVDTVLDGAAVVKEAAARRYDAILMDCQMPGLNGYEATEAIRNKEGASQHSPIIALTAGASWEDRERCLAAGMDAYLVKPVSKDALLAQVAVALGEPAGSTFRAHRPHASATDPPLPFNGGPTLAVAALPERTGARSDRPGPVLDPAVVERLERLGASSGEDLVSELAALFLADAENQLEGLGAALAAGDAAALARCAHSLAGASVNLGANELARLCAALAGEAAERTVAGADVALLEAVEAELEHVRTALLERAPTP